MTHFGKLSTIGTVTNRRNDTMRLINHHILLVDDFVPRSADYLKKVERELVNLDAVSKVIIQIVNIPFQLISCLRNFL